MDFSGQLAVGHDGSAESAVAVRWAAGLAKAAGKPLNVVHGWIWPMLTDDLGPVEGVADSGLRNAAKQVLREGAALATAAAPGVEVRTTLITGQGRTVLTEVSKTADLLIVGSRGLGGFLGMLLGSVSLGIITHAGCPVIVVRREQERPLPILVGVDGSTAALEAVDTAVLLAQARHTSLEVVHVVRSAQSRDMEAPDEAQRILDEGMTRAREADPGLEVSGRIATGRSIPRALLDAAENARMIVLGFQGMGMRPFGSVVHAVVHHLPGNIAVTRHMHVPIDSDQRPQVVDLD